MRAHTHAAKETKLDSQSEEEEEEKSYHMKVYVHTRCELFYIFLLMPKFFQCIRKTLNAFCQCVMETNVYHVVYNRTQCINW